MNSRPSPWQGDALPLSYSRFGVLILRIRLLLSSEPVSGWCPNLRFGLVGQAIHETTRTNTKMLLVIFRGISWIVLDFSAYLRERQVKENEIRTLPVGVVKRGILLLVTAKEVNDGF